MQKGILEQIKILFLLFIENINELKQLPGKDIIISGSPSAVHSLMQLDLIDDFWLFVNPIVIGKGIPLFNGLKEYTRLKLLESNKFSSGVVCPAP